jgi:regulator of sigma E protease
MSSGLLGGITFILVLAGMILVHEIGHFVAARLMKIEVEEFGFGIPPKLFTIFTWKGVQFTFNLLPLGGFVRLKGEDDPSVTGGLAQSKPWKRAVVLLAGAGMNLLTAVLAYSILFTNIGVPDKTTTLIVDVQPDSPAGQAGIVPGDILLVMAGQHISGEEQIREITYQYLGEELSLGLLRDGSLVEVTITPRTEWPAGQGPMGIAYSHPLAPVKNWFSALSTGFQVTGQDMGSIISLPVRLIAGTARPEEGQLGGPRSIWNFFQAAVTSDLESRQATDSQETRPTYYTLIVIIGLSISLGTLNLFPIPALDGGRLLFLIPELLFKRAIPAKYQMAINTGAFILLILFMVVFYIKDFIDPITITLP